VINSWTKRDALLGGAVSLFSLSSAAAQLQNPPLVRAPQQPASPPPTSVVLRSDQIELLLRVLTQAYTHGFEPAAFSPEPVLPLLNAREAAARQAGQAQLIGLTLRYAKAVRTGRLAPDAFLGEWGLRPAPYDPGPDFIQAAAQDRLGPWLDSLPPPYTGYQTLRKGLATYRDIAAAGGWKSVASGEPLKLANFERLGVSCR
jgi:murein L,D-transpeptidase YcbB/YkuD